MKNLIAFVVLILFSSYGVACDSTLDPTHECWNPPNKYVSSGLKRFYALGDLIESGDGECKKVIGLAKEYLKLAKEYNKNWNYGNAIHDGNAILGMCSLNDGDIAKANEYLLAASRSPGSPQLDSFGPELKLANELLKLNQDLQVIKYLENISTFWKETKTPINEVILKIKNGETPELDRFKILLGV